MTTKHYDAHEFDATVTFGGAVEFTGSVQMPGNGGSGPTFTTNPESGAAVLVGATYKLCAHLDTTVSATARTVHAPVPADGFGEVIEVAFSCDVQIATGSLILTPNISGGASGTPVTLASGTAALSHRQANQAAGVLPVVGGDTVRAVVSGTNTANGRGTVVWTIRQLNPGT